MRSHNKLRISVRSNQAYGKRWAHISPLYGKTTCPECHTRFVPEDWEWIPSFEDQMRMLWAVGYCEDIKYPNGKGRKFILELVQRLMEFPPEPSQEAWDVVWLQLCREFRIPIRDDRADAAR